MRRRGFRGIARTRDRPARFPQSVVLRGVRDMLGGRIRSASRNETALGGSACSIKAESLRLSDFSEGGAHALPAGPPRHRGERSGQTRSGTSGG